MYCSNIVGSQSPESFGPQGRCPSLGTVDVCGGSRRCDECLPAEDLEVSCVHAECHEAFVLEVRRIGFERAASDILCLVDERAEDANFIECERREEWRTAQR